MFYSHEILTSPQYGVSTIWLVATVGSKSSSRKITRKAIQDVDIPAACETFIQPAAPIALRLQSHLLYGVSRIYQQKCAYMITDAEKVQSHIQTWFNVRSTSTTDPQAGKTKREQLIVLNDPSFEIQFDLPDFGFDEDGNIVTGRRPKSHKETQSSQMSPFSNNILSSSQRSAGELLISHSPASVSFHHLQMSMNRNSLPSQKLGGELDMGAREEEPLILDEDWGFAIDEDGNIINNDEPELPALPDLHSDPAAPALSQDEPGPMLGGEDEMQVDMGANALPEAQAFPLPQGGQEQPAAAQDATSDPVEAAAPVRRQRARKLIVPDDQTMLSRTELRALDGNYLERMAQPPPKSRQPTAAQVRRNFFAAGIFGVGVDNGITGPNHPLAQIFAGRSLQKYTFGFVLDSSDDEGKKPAPQPAGQRRTSGEAFPEDAEADEGRRVRPRLDDTQPGQAAQLSVQEHDGVYFEPDIEVGREPGSVLSNHSAPWNRPGSVAGSSVKGGSVRAGPSRVSASPLHGRGSANLPAIERLSDDMPFMSDGPLPQRSSSPFFGGEDDRGAAATSQVMRNALDGEGRNFLGFVEGIAASKEADEYQRRWADFDDLFEPRDANKHVVTQAFMHVLTLATRDVIKVRQQDSLEVQFGPIRIGVIVPAGVVEGEGAEEVEGEGQGEGGDDDAMVFD